MPPARGHGSPRRRRAGGHGGGHGGGEEEGGAERWLVTYADMLTLLLVLFIVLFSISVVNTSKFISLKTSLAAVFGDGTKGMLSGGNGLNENDAQGTGQQLVMPGSPAAPQVAQKDGKPAEQAVKGAAALASGYTREDVEREVDDYKHIRAAVSEALDAHGMQGAVKFAITRRGLVMTVVTNGLVFPGNSANLQPDGRKILAAIAPALVHEKRQIEVDGYTNQLNVSTGPYPSGWELSSARASAVVRQLIAAGVTESRLSAVGYSDQHPLYPVSDPRAVTQNRRVEIVALSSLPSTAGADLVAAANQH
jgi:chemotaxis protein MotB